MPVCVSGYIRTEKAAKTDLLLKHTQVSIQKGQQLQDQKKMSLLQSTSGKHAYTRTRQHTCRENSFMSVFFRVVGVFGSESRSLLLRQRLSCSDLTECTRENRWSRVKFRVRNPLSNMIKDLIPPEIGWCCLSMLSVSRNNCRVLGR